MFLWKEIIVVSLEKASMNLHFAAEKSGINCNNMNLFIEDKQKSCNTEHILITIFKKWIMSKNTNKNIPIDWDWFVSVQSFSL